MTEPDEALLYARLRAKGRMSSPNNPQRAIARRVEVDAGKHDAELSDEAQAYRAGQAASAERIKALEGLLRDTTVSLIGAHSLLKNGGKNAMPSDKMFFIMLEDFEKDIERARALLKEADQ